MKLAGFNMNIKECPLNKPVWLYGESMMFKVIFKGTLTTNPYDGTIIRGECLEGDADMFYRSAILGWRNIE